MGLGQRELALKNANLFERNYGRRLNQDTASVLLSVGGIYLHQKQWSRAEEHYRSFLGRYGRTARPDEAIRARVALGFALWEQEGRGREKAPAELRAAVAPADRGRPDEETTRERLSRYRKMLAPGGEGGDDAELTTRLVQMVTAVAKARFYLAEASYQEFTDLRLHPFRPAAQLPRGARAFWTKRLGREESNLWEQALRYMEPDERRRQIANVQFEHWNETELRPWVEHKEAARARAEQLYLEVVREDVPEWEIAAAARVGEMYRTLMQGFYDAPIPPVIAEDEELRAIYEQRLDELAEPYRRSAVGAYEHCLQEATRNRWFNRWSGECETALNRLSPLEYPMSDELRASPDSFASPLAIPQMVARLRTNDADE
jgi:hypothetical protein